MNKQFFYREKPKDKQGREVPGAEITSSFGIDHVLKTSQSINEGLIITLNDGRIETVPVYQRDKEGQVIFKKDGTPNKITSYQQYVFTEIELSKEESIEFIGITGQKTDFPLLYQKPEVKPTEPVNYSNEVAVD